MGAPSTGMQAGEQASAETLLGAFKTIKAAERRKHASVLNYWLSIRGDKEFPPLHDLDPLELSDAGPNSALLELISGGHDAEIRHLGEALRDGEWPERIMDAPSPSILACIGKKLPIVAISRDFLAFEDEFSDASGTTRCWVTLLPLSAGGAWVDYVYALVSLDTVPAKGAKAVEKPKVEEPDEPVAEEPVVEESTPVEEPIDEVAEEVEEPEAAVEPEELADEEEQAPAEEPVSKSDKGAAKAAPGFSKLFDSLAGLTGFHAQSVKVEPVLPEAPASKEEEPEEEVAEEPVAVEQPVEPEEIVADEPEPEEVAAAAEPTTVEKPKQPSRVAEGVLHDKLTEVRAKADEARMAKLRANAALYEGLSAAYDFALDAEDSPEEYLRLVEAQGLKIQLRSPMKPVVKLAFDGMCDEMTIKQLEAVLAWAFDKELPRGSLAEQIEAAGGVGRILGGEAKAA
ncbi:MAG: hypothetical protein ACJ8FT_07820 [Sphingomonas sp.]